jgi:hypothetical protein
MQNVSYVEGMLLDGSLHALFQGARSTPRVSLVCAHPCVTSVRQAFACKEEYTALDLHEAQTCMPPLVCESELCRKIVRCNAFSSFHGKLPILSCACLRVCMYLMQGLERLHVSLPCSIFLLASSDRSRTENYWVQKRSVFLKTCNKSLRRVLFLHYLQLRGAATAKFKAR